MSPGTSVIDRVLLLPFHWWRWATAATVTGWVVHRWANPIYYRYLLNSTNVDEYVRGDDGSLVFYISKESPGKDLGANWLPAPDDPFYLAMRLYGPEPAALSGDWSPPALEKATPPAASASAAKPAASADKTVENLVRRTYQYVAMYSVINKNAMMEENPQRAG